MGRRGTNPGEKDGADRTAKLDEQRADRTAKPDEDARVPDRNARRMSRATNARSTEDSRADVCANVCGEEGPATAPRRMCFIPEVGPVRRIREVHHPSHQRADFVARTGWADDEHSKNRVVNRRALRLRLPTSPPPYVSASLRLTNPRAHTTSPPPGKCHIFASVRPSAAHSAATSSSSCAAESATRSRLVPGGTVGGRIAGT